MEISKVQLPNREVYQIKDEYFRHMINVLLGIEEPDERDIK
uniref:Uncharacterized protein n=1 Tax=virus sp. ct8MV80 TaxID=2826793 RepID=A0A8S5R8M9_9VIRU|nr:MAG TPA: hypothetical protein [virus sp. ct8MV80]DAG36110.1 MAG TPA: hypothetical protein [Caudoviricetes sp.]DAW91603.1 MAG TPA: hypothetical protein [Bacteriophage sp.]